MTDREKVIRGLETIKQFFGYGLPSTAEMFDSYYGILNDTIALLKRQEAKQAIKQTYHVMMNRGYENPVEITHYAWFCPTCCSLLCRDTDVIDDNYHFCRACGQRVKWGSDNLPEPEENNPIVGVKLNLDGSWSGVRKKDY